MPAGGRVPDPVARRAGCAPHHAALPAADRALRPRHLRDRGLGRGDPGGADREPHTHRVDVERTSRTHRTVTLHSNDSIPNKDLVLRCRVAGDGPETGVLSYHDGRSGYLTVLLHPEIDPAPRDVTPKEMIFVLDCSGSMSGEPMAAAKGLVRHALKNVNAHDTFQILRFSTKASGFRPQPIAATPGNVKAGLHYLEGLRGGGGTMMVEGIKAALDFPSDPDRLRIVLFLTDGYIGNEDDIFRAVQQRIGDARLFSLGVGSSPKPVPAGRPGPRGARRGAVLPARQLRGRRGGHVLRPHSQSLPHGPGARVGRRGGGGRGAVPGPRPVRPVGRWW